MSGVADLVAGRLPRLGGELGDSDPGGAAAAEDSRAVVNGVKNWWRVGFHASVANLAIWIPVGLLWWKILGLW